MKLPSLRKANKDEHSSRSAQSPGLTLALEIPSMLGICSFALFASIAVSRAEMVQNPDHLTLWQENGQEIEVIPEMTPSDEYWFGTLVAQEASEGGFVLTGQGDKYIMQRYVAMSNEYPWLVMEIDDVEQNLEKLYQEIRVSFSGDQLGFSMIGEPKPGLYVGRVMREDSYPPDPTTMRVDLRNTTLRVAQLQMMAEPPNRIEMQAPTGKENGKIDVNDELTFRVFLEEPAEQVTITFYDGYTMPQIRFGEEMELPLEPEASSGDRIWSAKVTATPIALKNKKIGEVIEPGRLLIKAEIEGGSLDTPIWTWNAVEMALNPGD